MRESRVYRTEAIVLKGYDYGEADRILTLLTPHLGKLSAIAKGVRRTKSRMSGHVDLFTRSSLLIARGRQLDIITQADTLENFRPVRSDLWRSSPRHFAGSQPARTSTLSRAPSSCGSSALPDIGPSFTAVSIAIPTSSLR